MRGRLRFLQTRSGAVGLGLVTFVVLVAVFGRYFAPHGPSASIGVPLGGPSGDALLGTDSLGRDVFSRLLYGGRSVIAPLLRRTVDVMLAFPPLLFLLVLITGAGTGVGVLVIGVAAIQAPGISRIVRTATLEVSVRGYVEAAVARGERAAAVVIREVLPN